VILFAVALSATQPAIVDWQPFSMQRTPDGGLFDRTSARRTADVVNAWVRLVNVEFKGVNKAREQTDLRMELDCRSPRMRIVGYRVVRPDDTILKDIVVARKDAAWRPAGVGTWSADVRIALCARVR
jgi:hypothetical protein